MDSQENCQKALDHLIEELDHNKDADLLLVEFEAMYPNCQEEIKGALTLWEDLAEIEVPEASSEMHIGFYRALNSFEGESEGLTEAPVAKTRSISSRLVSLFRYAAAAVVLVAAGFIIGRQGNADDRSQSLLAYELIAPMSGVDDLEVSYRGGATEKLAVIQQAKDIENPTGKIFAALNQALLTDQSTNVRLSAIESLVYFADYPEVRSYLIKAIPFQESPIVQIALADAMIELQERESLAPIRKMLESGRLDLGAKGHFEDALKILM